MHEYSIVSALLERVSAEARAHNATAVHRLTLRIGDGAGVERELLSKAYEHFRAGTICARAELCIEPRRGAMGLSGVRPNPRTRRSPEL